MKRILLLCAVLAASAFTVQSAKADDFTISFDGGPLGYSGSGVFVGSQTNPGLFDITGVLSGGSVTDSSAGGYGTSSITGVSDFAGGDNVLTHPDAGQGFFDGNGLSFDLANGVEINLFSVFDINNVFLSAAALDSNGTEELVTASVSTFTAPSTPVPELSSIVFLGTSAVLGAADLFRRRRLLA